MEPVPVAATATTDDAEMGDFNGQWIHIFDAGNYGDKGNWPVEKLQQVVENFRRLKAGVKVLFAEKVLRHNPAAVIGHSHSDRDPALGWVDALQLKGGQLWAKFRDVHPILESAVAEKRYPERSVELYRDFQGLGPALRRVAFLGAVPPEVKSLQPIQFNDNGSPWVAINKEDTVKTSTHAEHDTTPAPAAAGNGNGEKVEVPKGPMEVVKETIKKVMELIKPAEEAVEELEDEAKPVDDDDETTSAPAAAPATPAATMSDRLDSLETQLATKTFMEAMPSNLSPSARARIEAVVPSLIQAEGSVSFSEGKKQVSQLALTTFAEIIVLASKNGLTVPTTPVVTGGRQASDLDTFSENIDQDSVVLKKLADKIAKEEDISFAEALPKAREKQSVAHAGRA